jgi:hypothetical protein
MRCALNCLAGCKNWGLRNSTTRLANRRLRTAWVGQRREMAEKLRSIPDEVPIYGDVYARQT